MAKAGLTQTVILDTLEMPPVLKQPQFEYAYLITLRMQLAT